MESYFNVDSMKIKPFNEEVRTWLNERGIKHVWAADKIGISRSHFANFLAGVYSLSFVGQFKVWMFTGGEVARPLQKDFHPEDLPCFVMGKGVTSLKKIEGKNDHPTTKKSLV